MKHVIIALVSLCTTLAFGQDIPTIQPEIGLKPDLSEEAAKKFNSEEAFKTCEAIWAKMEKENVDYKNLSTADKKALRYCDETKESVWDIEGGGCSWYCGGGPQSVSASSELKASDASDYTAGNAHDGSLKKAWVEGVSGYGIGEYLEYSFNGKSARVNQIKIYNGYVKSSSAWKSNSRVKRLKMYVNDKPYAYLDLQDTKAEQTFKIDPVGHFKDEKDWTLKFEIADVYKGEKYDDVVLTEIYFDGLDVHCLVAGTEISLADGSTEKIEDIAVGSLVLTNPKTREHAEVLEVASAKHEHLTKIKLENGVEITCTQDHPVQKADGSWASSDPEKTKRDYNYSSVELLEVGDKLLFFAERNTVPVTITKIETLPEEQTTYTIIRTSKGNSFIANGVIVGTETLRDPEY